MLSKSKFEFSSSIMAKKIMYARHPGPTKTKKTHLHLASQYILNKNYAEEEQKEVSSNLHHLRQIYDKTKDDVKARQKDLDQMEVKQLHRKNSSS